MKKLTLILLAIVAVACSTDEGIVDPGGYKPNTDKNDDDKDDDDNTPTPSNSAIEVYTDYPEVILESAKNGYIKRSTFYSVEVSNTDQSEELYVISDRNQYQMHDGTSGNNSYMTYHNHVADFSFNGEVKVKIKRLDGEGVDNAVVYPKIKGYTYSVVGDCLEISLNEWAYIYVEFPDLKKEPLFIFADPMESNAPKPNPATVEIITPDMSAFDVRDKINSTSKKTIYFTPGVYDFDPSVTDNTYSGYQLPLISDKDYYIPRGAVIVGSFYGKEVANSKMYGRGMITGCTKERLSNSESIPYSLYSQEGGDGCSVEGIYFNNPPHFAILSRNDLVTRHCKMTGWWHQTDGWGAGDNSVVENCFFKSMDDNMKVYSDNMKVTNIVLYKQINGAGIQYGWGGGGAQNLVVDGLYVVGDDNKNPGVISNTAVVNLVSNTNNTSSNHTYKNVYVECDYQRFLGIALEDGNFENFTFENIVIDGACKGGNNYLFNQNGTTGKFSNFTFKDLVINGNKITSDKDKDWNLVMGELSADNKTFTAKDLTEAKYE